LVAVSCAQAAAHASSAAASVQMFFMLPPPNVRRAIRTRRANSP
jgi:hypothetical protein